ncbi:MAG TPA: hypothetical protein VIE43_03895 [Thermoanaerobaculia bacterium]|nr:hypothetical protein [Thermoanaerobaculia bacterium]
MPVFLDHFKFYDVVPLQVSREVALKGQFDDDMFLGAFLPEVLHLGAAVSKNGEPISDKKRYMTSYSISAGPEPPRRVLISNQFGTQELILDQPELLLTPAVYVDPTAPMPEPLDHYKCYRVTSGPPIEASVLLADFFDPADSNRVTVPLFFGVPVEKRYGGLDEPIGAPDDHLTLYEILPKAYVAGGTIQDQFRTGELDILRSRMLAVPTTKLEWELA